MLLTLGSFAQGPYAPAANQLGSTAIYKNAANIADWATAISVVRGKQNIANSTSDTTSVGSWSSALSKADGVVISLGDSGQATLQFSSTIYNGIGPDFAVFENAFNPTFLELAFVEVSSDGQNFFRFPAHSLTDTAQAVGSFGSVDATNINNLAGKYQVNYGTPFDLEELRGISGLDLMKISYIRIIDVVGSLNSRYATRDTANNKINDQYPTAFPSGGFDLDAVGVMYVNPVGIAENSLKTKLQIFPNPVKQELTVINGEFQKGNFELLTMNGQLVETGNLSDSKIAFKGNYQGIYILRIANSSTSAVTKLSFR